MNLALARSDNRIWLAPALPKPRIWSNMATGAGVRTDLADVRPAAGAAWKAAVPVAKRSRETQRSMLRNHRDREVPCCENVVRNVTAWYRHKKL